MADLMIGPLQLRYRPSSPSGPWPLSVTESVVLPPDRGSASHDQRPDQPRRVRCPQPADGRHDGAGGVHAELTARDSTVSLDDALSKGGCDVAHVERAGAGLYRLVQDVASSA